MLASVCGGDDLRLPTPLFPPFGTSTSGVHSMRERYENIVLWQRIVVWSCCVPLCAAALFPWWGSDDSLATVLRGPMPLLTHRASDFAIGLTLAVLLLPSAPLFPRSSRFARTACFLNCGHCVGGLRCLACRDGCRMRKARGSRKAYGVGMPTKKPWWGSRPGCAGARGPPRNQP